MSRSSSSPISPLVILHSTPSPAPNQAQLVAGGVDLVLNGHNHVYERLKPMRTMGDVDDHAPWTVIAGTGGRSLVPTTSVHPNSVARAAGYGIYKMALYPDHWIGAHKGTDGATRDLKSIGCH